MLPGGEARGVAELSASGSLAAARQQSESAGAAATQ